MGVDETIVVSLVSSDDEEEDVKSFTHLRKACLDIVLSTANITDTRFVQYGFFPKVFPNILKHSDTRVALHTWIHPFFIILCCSWIFHHCRAYELLEATQEMHASEGETAWAEACLVQLAVDNEIEAETAEVGRAMKASMEEKEHNKSSETPLEEKDLDAVLCSYDGTSKIAAALLEVCHRQAADLLAIEKKLLIDWLEFEQRCYRWYPMSSRGYFEDFANKLRTEESIDTLGNVLRTRLEKLQQEVFSFPGDGGLDTPSSFLPYHSNEVIDLDNES